jgi:hypothetical protein
MDIAQSIATVSALRYGYISIYPSQSFTPTPLCPHNPHKAGFKRFHALPAAQLLNR